MKRPYVKAPMDILNRSGFSSDAKVAYSLILNRFSLSQKNGWKDENGRTYIIYPIAEIALALGCSRSKVTRVLAELGDLIEKKRQGLCKPDIIYVNENIDTESAEETSAEIFDQNSNSEIHEENSCESLTETEESSGCNTYENPDAKHMKFRMHHDVKSGCRTYEIPDVANIDTNNNNINKNNLKNNNFNNLSYRINQYDVIDERDKYKKIIKSNIDYNSLVANFRKPYIDDIVSVMLNAVCSVKDYFKIGGEEVPSCLVKQKLLSLDYSHIEYVYDCISKSKVPIKNISAYLLACLYNADDVINIHYANMAWCDGL